jgi:hypothetical protein
MTKATRTKETANGIVTITLTREVNDKVAYLDGYNLVTGREVYESYEVTLTHKASGKVKRTSGKPGGFAFFTLQPKLGGPYPAGAYARVGDTYVSRETYDLAMGMIAELDAEVGKTADQAELEAAMAERERIAQANLDRMAAEDAARRNHPGWCDKCQSYCYGDCSAH